MPEYLEFPVNFVEISSAYQYDTPSEKRKWVFEYIAEMTMDALVQALLIWISHNSQYNISEITSPVVVIMSPVQITREYYGERTDLIPEGGVDERIWALYDAKSTAKGRVYLRSPNHEIDAMPNSKRQSVTSNDLEDPIFQERLLHELIHHVQYQSGAVHQLPCPEFAEKEAYLLGGLFLKKRYAEDPMPNRNFWAHMYSRC